MNDRLVISPLGIEVTEKKKTFISLLLIPIILLTLSAWTCNFQSTINTIDSILAEVGPAVQIVVSLLPLLTKENIPPNVVSGINAWVPVVTQDVSNLQSIVTQYQSDLTDPTVQAKINAVIQTTENDVTSVLTMLKVLDPATQEKITAIVTAVGAAIISVENIINSLKAKAGVKVAFKASPNQQFYKNGKDFVSKFNVVLHLPTGNPTVDGATAQLSLK
jgi:hypothetical protein